MKRTFLWKTVPLLVIISALVLTVSFAQTNAGTARKNGNDTVPQKEKQVRNLDEALIELDKGEADMQKALRQIDGEKMEREMREAMKHLEMDKTKMKEYLARAMKELDAQKMNLEMQKDMVNMQKELKEINAEKIRQQAEEAVAKIDTEKMKAQLEKVKEIDFSKMKKELEDMRPEIEKSMREAKKNIEKARQELTSYKNLVNALNKDGYLNKDASYKVEYRSGELTVNGKKLPADAVKKYNEYLSDKKDFTLQKDSDGLNIHNK
ncbi:hypothetical protein [Flavisolibacter ginsenosidimutans]|uniref:Uncharacterized protein n=1 Tax=Flavisolibacter ginsenosidimutans TaxID=661481 RepID=A0A5B8UK40_9BACT|nr:hypothetical protein [Flavisolibacter ginsenosidimutans]QEC56410.1 hypothetical protein FSB75_11075 [Flavisolibacter ginsenosidimutans]